MSIPDASALSPQQAALFAHKRAAIMAAADLATLQLVVEHAVEDLLRRAGDSPHRSRTLDEVKSFFARVRQTDKALPALKAFSEKLILLVLSRRADNPRPPPEAPPEERPIRRATEVPWHQRPLGPTSIVMVMPPPPTTHDTFEQLMTAAICQRIAVVTTFFQRRNPEMRREMPVPFLQSAVFAERLEEVVRTYVLPQLMRSRAARVLEAKHPWTSIDTDAFWDTIERDGTRGTLMAAWHDAWATFRQRRVVVKQSQGDPGREVLRAVSELQDIRALLASDGYLMPRVGNRDLDLFASLLDPEYDRRVLENAWTRLRQLYEQEMDRRVYQDKARYGAFRDSLLQCFDDLPDRIGEFLAMLSYYSFPRLTMNFLEDFTRNKGSNVEERRKRIPYLLWFLEYEQVSQIKAVEREREEEEARRIAAELAERKALELARESEGAVVWQRN